MFQRGDGSDSAAQTLAAANAAAAAASMAADTIAAEAAVAVIAAAEVTQIAADKTAELKVATAAKTQVLSPLCCNISTHPHKHTRTHKNICVNTHTACTSVHTNTQKFRANRTCAYIHTQAQALSCVYTQTEKMRDLRKLSIYIFAFIYMYIYKWGQRNTNLKGSAVNSSISSFGIYTYMYIHVYT